MNVDYMDGTRSTYRNLTAEDVAQKTKEAIEGDKEIESITIWPEGPNRHERRRRAALARRKDAPQRARK